MRRARADIAHRLPALIPTVSVIRSIAPPAHIQDASGMPALNLCNPIPLSFDIPHFTLLNILRSEQRIIFHIFVSVHIF